MTETVEEDQINPLEMNTTNFNYPGQSDVLISSLDCRTPFNQWILLGKAIGKKDGQSASRRDVPLKRVKVKTSTGLRDGWVACIKILGHSPYYPPPPTVSSTIAQFSITKDGEVSFPIPDTARRYTVMSFLMVNYRVGMDSYFNTIMADDRFKFIPQRLRIGARRRDPPKMAIFYDNDLRGKNAIMAVCIKVDDTLGVFALVDDFGRILQQTAHRFLITK